MVPWRKLLVLFVKYVKPEKRHLLSSWIELRPLEIKLQANKERI